jgi:hypothetical protein
VKEEEIRKYGRHKEKIIMKAFSEKNIFSFQKKNKEENKTKQKRTGKKNSHETI